MMHLNYTKSFLKDFRKLAKNDRDRVRKAIELFRNDPFRAELHNHKLKGKMRGMQSIAAGHDLRILYREEDGHVIVFLLRVGAHNQVY